MNHWKDKPNKGLRIAGMILLGITGATVFAFLFGYFVMHLWNWLLPEIFGVTTITFWQAVGIVILARLIFGGFKHSHDKSPKDKFNGPPWKDKFKKCPPPQSGEKWKYYDSYWKEEGEESFNQYVEKKKETEE
jgi:hypothetical protein